MTEHIEKELPDNLLHKLNSETAKIAWKELQPFFAKGMAIYVSHTMDLIKVAYELSQDNKEQMEKWMADGVVANVSDLQAGTWYESDILVWCVVVHPWILVQPIVD